MLRASKPVSCGATLFNGRNQCQWCSCGQTGDVAKGRPSRSDGSGDPFWSRHGRRRACVRELCVTRLRSWNFACVGPPSKLWQLKMAEQDIVTDLATQSPSCRSRPPAPTTPRGAPAPHEISGGAIYRKRVRPSTSIPPTGVLPACGVCVACYYLSNIGAAKANAKTCSRSRYCVQRVRGVQPIPAVSDVENPEQDGEQDGVQVGPALADVEHYGDGTADTLSLEQGADSDDRKRGFQEHCAEGA